MASNEPTGPARRIVIRRSRTAGFAGGSSTRAESLRTAAEADEVDDAIDPDNIRDTILHRTQAAPALDSGTGGEDDGTMPDARQRLNQVAMAGSANYSKEYRLTLLNRLLQRRVPLDQIANTLQVSISTIEKDRVELKKRLREGARQLNINEIIGTQTELYDEISGMSLRIASSDKTPTAMKLAAMRTTLAANADRTRFLNSAGVFDVLRYRLSEDGSEISDIQLLMERTDEMLASLTAQPETPSAPRRSRAKPAGFQPFTMDDADASSGDAEDVEL